MSCRTPRSPVLGETALHSVSHQCNGRSYEQHVIDVTQGCSASDSAPVRTQAESMFAHELLRLMLLQSYHSGPKDSTPSIGCHFAVAGVMHCCQQVLALCLQAAVIAASDSGMQVTHSRAILWQALLQLPQLLLQLAQQNSLYHTSTGNIPCSRFLSLMK